MGFPLPTKGASPSIEDLARHIFEIMATGLDWDKEAAEAEACRLLAKELLQRFEIVSKGK